METIDNMQEALHHLLLLGCDQEDHADESRSCTNDDNDRMVPSTSFYNVSDDMDPNFWLPTAQDSMILVQTNDELKDARAAKASFNGPQHHHHSLTSFQGRTNSDNHHVDNIHHCTNNCTNNCTNMVLDEWEPSSSSSSDEDWHAQVASVVEQQPSSEGIEYNDNDDLFLLGLFDSHQENDHSENSRSLEEWMELEELCADVVVVEDTKEEQQQQQQQETIMSSSSSSSVEQLPPFFRRTSSIEIRIDDLFHVSEKKGNGDDQEFDDMSSCSFVDGAAISRHSPQDTPQQELQAVKAGNQVLVSDTEASSSSSSSSSSSLSSLSSSSSSNSSVSCASSSSSSSPDEELMDDDDDEEEQEESSKPPSGVVTFSRIESLTSKGRKTTTSRPTATKKTSQQEKSSCQNPKTDLIASLRQTIQSIQPTECPYHQNGSFLSSRGKSKKNIKNKNTNSCCSQPEKKKQKCDAPVSSPDGTTATTTTATATTATPNDKSPTTTNSPNDKSPTTTNSPNNDKSSPPCSTPSRGGVIGDMDVLLGRGKKAFAHKGNQIFRHYIQTYSSQYKATKSRTEKMRVIQIIMNLVESSGGRFLKCNPGENEDTADASAWQPVPRAVAHEKVGHSLRGKKSSKKEGGAAVAAAIVVNKAAAAVAAAATKATVTASVGKSSSSSSQ